MSSTASSESLCLIFLGFSNLAAVYSERREIWVLATFIWSADRHLASQQTLVQFLLMDGESMRKLPAYLLAILVGGIIWFFFSHFKIEGTDSVRVVPKSEEELNQTGRETGTLIERLRKVVSTVRNPTEPIHAPLSGVGEPPLAGADLGTRPVVQQTTTERMPKKRSPETIQVASVHLHYFGSASTAAETIDVAAKIIRFFDIVAVQGITPAGTASVRDLAAQAGQEYDVIMGAPADVQHQDERFAYIFNRNTIVADRDVGLYTLGDADNLLRREPLVGWFRAKKAPENEAFTFTLVNVSTDESHAIQELDVLDNAMHEIRKDGREEDDVIMLGSFQAPHNQLGELGRVHSLVTAIIKPATDLRGISQSENIVFRSIATDEYTGRSGVFHFLRAFNLLSEQAMAVSEYLPVWAEFSIYETGQRGGRVADMTEEATQR